MFFSGLFLIVNCDYTVKKLEQLRYLPHNGLKGKCLSIYISKIYKATFYRTII